MTGINKKEVHYLLEQLKYAEKRKIESLELKIAVFKHHTASRYKDTAESKKWNGIILMIRERLDYLFETEYGK